MPFRVKLIDLYEDERQERAKDAAAEENKKKRQNKKRTLATGEPIGTTSSQPGPAAPSTTVSGTKDTDDGSPAATEDPNDASQREEQPSAPRASRSCTSVLSA